MSGIGYVIRDNNGNFPWRLGLSRKEESNQTCWDYVTSLKHANTGHGNLKLAEATVQRLQELNSVAQIPGLSWEIVEDNDFVKPIEQNEIKCFEHDIPEGHVTNHRKAVKEICKKYKTIFREIEMKWREKTNGGGAPIH